MGSDHLDAVLRHEEIVEAVAVVAAVADQTPPETGAVTSPRSTAGRRVTQAKIEGLLADELVLLQPTPATMRLLKARAADLEGA